jgi:hypothetical protein
MASDVLNRKVVREQLAALIDAGLDSTWDVFNYGTSVFNGKARNVIVASGDTDYQDNGAKSTEVAGADVFFDFNIGIFILYADAGQSWTAQNSEDALDLGRKLITDIVRDNRDNANWYRLSLNGRSAVGVVEDLEGSPYRYEIVPVRVIKYS